MLTHIHIYTCSGCTVDSKRMYAVVVSCSGRCEAEACSNSEQLQRKPPTVKR